MENGKVHKMKKNKKIRNFVNLLSMSVMTIQISIAPITVGNATTFINTIDIGTPIFHTMEQYNMSVRKWYMCLTDMRNPQMCKTKSVVFIIL